MKKKYIIEFLEIKCREVRVLQRSVDNLSALLDCKDKLIEDQNKMISEMQTEINKLREENGQDMSYSPSESTETGVQSNE